MTRYQIVLACALVLLLASCGRREIKLDRITRRAIDTTASKQKVILRVELDSLCEMRFDSMVGVAVDSILERRRLEIEKITRYGK